MDSTQVIKEAIYEINGHRDWDSATTEAIVTAEVSKKVVVDEVPIKVMFTFDGTNYAKVDIFWEESGINDYKKIGLFGTLKTPFIEAKKDSARQVQIRDGVIFISIKY